jgi:predicted ATPase
MYFRVVEKTTAMRITSVNIPPSVSNNKLGHIKLDRLGKVVVLAGKNGSGKTRILKTIASVLEQMPTLSQYNSALEAQHQVLKMINSGKENLARLQDRTVRNQSWDRIIKSTEQSILVNNSALEKHKKVLEWNYLTTSERMNRHVVLNYVPNRLEIDDIQKMTNEKILQASASIENVGMSSLSSAVPARLQVVSEMYMYATHQEYPNQQSKAAVIREYNDVKDTLLKFLQANLTLGSNRMPELFGRPLNDARLSKGQIVLLQLCLAFHYQKARMSEGVIMLDEPENHLHPSAIIEVIEQLKSINSNGQIWIATHSVPLLAYFEPNEIFYVADGKVSYAGSEPERVLDSLLGGDVGVERLRDFVNLPAVYAANRFASECLIAPAVLETGIDDPQTHQIREILNGLHAIPLKVLDFGAGRGRLIANVAQTENTRGGLLDRLDYVAFDENSNHKAECIKAIAKAYEDSEGRYFNEKKELIVKRGREFAHIVVMCNVLHEIPARDWLDVFGKDGLILSALRKDGYLLIVEDQQLSVGERAHSNGFTVLDEMELMDLFRTSPSDHVICSSVGGKGRLKAHLIPRRCIARITASSRIKCLETLSSNAQDSIRNLREREKPSYRDGHRLAFWMQQYANAELSLKELKTKGVGKK